MIGLPRFYEFRGLPRFCERITELSEAELEAEAELEEDIEFKED